MDSPETVGAEAADRANDRPVVTRTRPVSPRPRGLQDLDRIDAVFAALAHPTRRQILTVLRARGGTMTSGDLAKRFDCTWPTTSRHLRLLADTGLVTVTKTGRQRNYTIDPTIFDETAGTWIDRFRP